MRIAVAGGTGTVGRHVVVAGREAGHEMVVISRHAGVDVLTGHGLDEALAGVDVVIDVTNRAAPSADRARAFFEAVTAALMGAGARVGVRHHVALSIVGIDGIDAGYYAGKLAQERAVERGPVPSTIVRAAQFHEFVGMFLGRGRSPLAVLPRALIRPVAAREVGTHLIAVAEAGPAGRARDLVGPRDEELVDLARRQLRHGGVRRAVLGVRLPGRYGAGMASGALRGGPDALPGTLTFDAWLDGPDHPSAVQPGR
ncbi:3-beta hydroxysteroid dehydrogenase [Propioniciclava coleopterorum]|uniref:3-beta hydroxysteroid dehydrogenase n=1 Tax=Propioniciclava coleopterorum TaxID=2714937 RepID=A0A6G7Y9Q1_9ACTN|nr:3-beta hydroxysteroid dehydrogenase [Propioniciclava coleopterorum]QIK73523.1 3-beta hydroxysteroid dehydrogenase [Propioniciclava coleopterorum]